MTSNQRKTVAIDLTGVKSVVNTLVSVADTAGVSPTDGMADQKVATLPDELVLIDANSVPSFYTYGLVFLWLGPICAILALALLAYSYIRNKSQYVKIALLQGAAITIVGLLSLLTGPLFRPPLLSAVTSPNMRIVVGNLYDSFIAIFNSQASVMVSLGLTLALVPLAVSYSLGLYKKKSLKKK